MNILLIDDTEELRELMKFHLGRNFPDAVVTTAENGQEAMMLVETIKFDVIVTDCNMPVMDGIEFVRQAREVGTLTPIFMWSGEVAPKVVGIDGYFHKDDTKGLFKAIREAA